VGRQLGAGIKKVYPVYTVMHVFPFFYLPLATFHTHEHTANIQVQAEQELRRIIVAISCVASHYFNMKLIIVYIISE
jgi:hypothetical protein